MQEGGQENVQAIYSRNTRRLVWIPQVPWDQTTHSKIAMPMTAASVAQRRMGFKAPRAQKYEGQSPHLVSQGFSRGGVTNRSEKEGPSSSGFSRGVYGHFDGRSPKDVKEQASEGRSVDHTSAQTASGESSGR